ncbi:MAG: DUF3048 domain-containing protein [Ardenticatenaceae bacterium]|nr:DUF3048 domain-containing protein [Ardenticatenaceae bacterium]
MKHFRLLAGCGWLVLAILLLAGCGNSSTAVSTPTTPPLPTATTSLPTTPPTHLPPTLAPTIPPPAIATNTPLALATTTLPPTIPAAPTATSAIEGLIGPDNFPDNVNPLTGEIVSDPAVLARRPLAIKISNAPPIVRPQSGLNSADLLFEHYAEGGLTRFTAVFYSHDADPVGSVRSGRLLDLEIPKMYDAGFAFSGASGPLKILFRESPFFDRVVSPDYAHGGFFRVEDPNKAFEHTLFTSTANLRWILDQRGQNTPPQFHSGMSFRAAPLAPGTPATSLEVGYQGTNVFWTYNAADGRYYRWADGNPHLDANTNQQVNFKNVIVLAAHHEDTDILEDNVGGGHYSIQIQIWGEGPVSIFRDGQRFDGLWHRNNPDDMLTFTDADGNILPLAPGNSFFQIVPLGFDQLLVTP